MVGAARPVGRYDVVSLTVPDSPVWAGARPGHAVVVPADPAAGRVLPGVHWLAGLDRDPVHGTTVELVRPAGHDWRTGQEVRLLVPGGRGFPLPAHPVPVLVVGHESSAAPLRWLAGRLRERGCEVHVVLSAREPDLHLEPASWRRSASSVVLTAPEELRATVAGLLDDPDPSVVFGAGPREAVEQVAAAAVPRGRVVRVTGLDPGEAIVCGTGLCGGCDLVVRDGRRTGRRRPCVEGPVVPGEWLVPAQEVDGGASR